MLEDMHLHQTRVHTHIPTSRLNDLANKQASEHKNQRERTIRLSIENYICDYITLHYIKLLDTEHMLS